MEITTKEKIWNHNTKRWISKDSKLGQSLIEGNRSVVKQTIVQTLTRKAESARRRLKSFEMNSSPSKQTTGKLTTHLVFQKFASSNTFSYEPLKYVEKVCDIDVCFNDSNKAIATSLLPSIDMDWFKASNDYIKNLSREDVYCVRAYANSGELASCVNSYLRFGTKPDHTIYKMVLYQAIKIIKDQHFNPNLYIIENAQVEMELDHVLTYGEYSVVDILKAVREASDDDITDRFYANGMGKTDLTGQHYWTTFPTIGKYLNSRFWEEALVNYVKRFNTIIKKSPKVSHEMKLYRGSETAYFLDHSKDFTHKEKGITSFSLSPKVFTWENSSKLILTLHPGSKALFVAGLSNWGETELEVVLPPGTTYRMRYGQKTMFTYKNNDDAITDVTGKKTVKLFITEADVM